MAAQSSPIKSSARDAEPAERPSLTLKRRLNAAPEKVYAAWADPQKLVQWFGPATVEEGSVKADIDLRVGGRYRISFNARGRHITRSAASIARSCRTSGWCSAGPGIRRRSGNRW